MSRQEHVVIISRKNRHRLIDPVKFKEGKRTNLTQEKNYVIRSHNYVAHDKRGGGNL